MEKEESKLKKFWNKFWFIVWKDNSPKGWLISVLFLFIVIKFIFFPTLSLITGTSLPLAIVESCSMYHSGNLFSSYDAWWQRHETKYSDLEIEKETFADFSLRRGFNKGDILFIVGTKAKNLKLGDVIIFNGGTSNPIIHRIINIREENGKKFFSTIGDNNNGQLSIEKEISEEQIVGRAVFRLVPYAGWIKLVFYEFIRPENERGFCEEN